MKYYEIKKSYRNCCDTYYIALNDDEDVSEDMLDSIGENTNGGENYGWTVESAEIKNLPPNEKLLQRERRVSVY